MTLSRKEICARHRAKNKDRIWLQQIQYKYGLTPEQYHKMIADQQNRCAICHQYETKTYKGTPKMLAVDHDHNTGKVRKLLCHNCNVTLGMVNEDSKILKRMIKYLEEHQDV